VSFPGQGEASPRAEQLRQIELLTGPADHLERFGEVLIRPALVAGRRIQLRQPGQEPGEETLLTHARECLERLLENLPVGSVAGLGVPGTGGAGGRQQGVAVLLTDGVGLRRRPEHLIVVAEKVVHPGAERRPVEPRQYLSVRYTDRLDAAGAAPSVGTVGDALDNALAESHIGLFKTELIRRHGPWKGLDDVKLATLEWVDWVQQPATAHRLPRPDPVEYEQLFYGQHLAQQVVGISHP
jgi:hypothetical protein